MKISIVIPVYNALEDLILCLESVKKAIANTNTELLIINDYSNEETTSFINSISYAKIIHNEENLGFIKTCNKGASAASGDIIILLNSDTIVPTKFIDRVVQCFSSNNNIAFASPLGGDKEIKYSPNITLDELNDFLYDKWDGVYHKAINVHGFCFCMRKSILDKIGLLDEIYGRGYFEEQDICIRALYNGYNNVVISNMYVYHNQCQSFGNKTRNQLIEKNKKIFDNRWYDFIKQYRKENRGKLYSLKRNKKNLLPLYKLIIANTLCLIIKILKIVKLKKISNYINNNVLEKIFHLKNI